MLHVLVIEDEYVIARCLADMARSAGASSVVVADSENGAVEAAMRHRPAIIVSDVDLQSGGRGPAAVVRIRETCGFVPAIFVTGNSGDTEAHRLGWAVLAKPVTTQSFASTFSLVVEKLSVLKMAAVGATRDDDRNLSPS